MRQTLPNICTCAASLKRPNNCPVGSPGSKGQNGAPGVLGDNGIPGKKGKNGKELAGILYSKKCIKCPLGRLGEVGHPGRQGPLGLRGNFNLIV